MHRITAHIVSPAGNHTAEVTRWIEAYMTFVGATDDRGCKDRDIHITPFGGAYGNAGFVITANGSPPKAAMVVLSGRVCIVLELESTRVKGEHEDFLNHREKVRHVDLRDATLDLIRSATKTLDG